MASTINSTTTGSGGLITTGDSSNQLELQTSNTTRVIIDSSGNFTIQGQGDLRLADSDSSNYVALQAPGTVASNVTFTLPSADGTSGQVIQTNGSGTLSFATPSTGAMFLLSTVTINNSATADVETTFDGTYDTYMIVGRILTTTVANPRLYCQLKVGGSYVTANYQYETEVSDASSTTYVAIAATSATEIIITNDLGADSSYSTDFVMYTQNPTSTSEQKSVFWTGRFRGSNTYQSKTIGQGAYIGATGALTGVRFYTSTNNLVGGTVRLYGIAKS